MATVPNEIVADWWSRYPAAATQPQGGIVSAAVPSTPKIDPNAFDISATGYTPNQATATNWNVAPNQTVQGQVDDITSKDGILMQRAATRARGEMNSRGLLNSSMAVGAGQAAVIDAALPIAQQDAGTFGNAAKYNADAANAMSTFNTGAQNTASQFSAGEQNTARAQSAQLGLTAATANQNTEAKAASQTSEQAAALQRQTASQQFDAAIRASMQGVDEAGKLEIQRMGDATRMALADIEGKWRQGMQTSSSMASIYQNLIDNVNRVLINPDLNAASKQATIDNLTAIYNNALQSQALISNMNLGALIAGGSLTAPADQATPASAAPPQSTFVPDNQRPET